MEPNQTNTNQGDVNNTLFVPQEVLDGIAYLVFLTEHGYAPDKDPDNLKVVEAWWNKLTKKGS